jgi:hypothetical protein
MISSRVRSIIFIVLAFASSLTFSDAGASSSETFFASVFKDMGAIISNCPAELKNRNAVCGKYKFSDFSIPSKFNSAASLENKRKRINLFPQNSLFMWQAALPLKNSVGYTSIKSCEKSAKECNLPKDYFYLATDARIDNVLYLIKAKSGVIVAFKANVQ